MLLSKFCLSVTLVIHGQMVQYIKVCCATCAPHNLTCKNGSYLCSHCFGPPSMFTLTAGAMSTHTFINSMVTQYSVLNSCVCAWWMIGCRVDTGLFQQPVPQIPQSGFQQPPSRVSSFSRPASLQHTVSN